MCESPRGATKPARPALPVPRDAVLVEDRFIGDEREPLLARLRNQHAIERVAMDPGQRPGDLCVHH